MSYEQIKELHAAFTTMDIDGDGTLTRRELRMLLSGLSRSLSEEIIAELVNKADTNRDGVITFREFKEAAQ